MKVSYIYISMLCSTMLLNAYNIFERIPPKSFAQAMIHMPTLDTAGQINIQLSASVSGSQIPSGSLRIMATPWKKILIGGQIRGYYAYNQSYGSGLFGKIYNDLKRYGTSLDAYGGVFIPSNGVTYYLLGGITYEILSRHCGALTQSLNFGPPVAPTILAYNAIGSRLMPYIQASLRTNRANKASGRKRMQHSLAARVADPLLSEQYSKITKADGNRQDYSAYRLPAFKSIISIAYGLDWWIGKVQMAYQIQLNDFTDGGQDDDSDRLDYAGKLSHRLMLGYTFGQVRHYIPHKLPPTFQP